MQQNIPNGAFNLDALANAPTNSPQLHAEAYPISTLPPEITSQIFLQSLPNLPDFPPLYGPGSPLQLCQICRQWSAIALSLPLLWSAVRMVITSHRKAPAMVELFKTWLSRSGDDSPLSLGIRSFADTHALSFFLRAPFAALAPRIEYLELAMPCDPVYMIRCDMPILQRLMLGVTGVPFWGKPSLTLFDRAPLLTHITLERGHNHSGCRIRLPWAQLTHLDAQCLSLTEYAQILCNAKRLEHCTFGIRAPKSDRPTDLPLVPPHDWLQYLVLRPGPDQSPDRDLWRLLDRLTLPALRTLEVFDLGLQPDSLQDFISRSQCTLDTLRITEGSRISEMAALGSQ
ncbi:hypothetical protein C8F04DRAFT_1175839 [Mycena alexandri]|uniref:F-box domain-containing protein n=1 Tax=Mycena alexandri TaxID=1745969 RepID=A0AAD6TC98_9AGAR|nr:hypothetical protein C8F04DRAFT_1175839 [Mycena alexandri]